MGSGEVGFAGEAAVTGVVPSHHPFGFLVDLGSLALGWDLDLALHRALMSRQELTKLLQVVGLRERLIATRRLHLLRAGPGGGCWFVSGTCDKFPDLG